VNIFTSASESLRPCSSKFQDIPGPLTYISRTFQDQNRFPGLSRPGNFTKKIQDFPGGVGTLCSIHKYSNSNQSICLWKPVPHLFMSQVPRHRSNTSDVSPCASRSSSCPCPSPYPCSSLYRSTACHCPCGSVLEKSLTPSSKLFQVAAVQRVQSNTGLTHHL